MIVKVMLVDVNPKMVAAWRAVFEDNPEVDIVQGSMTAQATAAWVSPTNAKGSMDGGLDGVIKNFLGAQIQTRVQQEIAAKYQGFLPVGHAVCAPTGRAQPAWLISTPTMVDASQDVSATLNVALSCAAALQMVHMQNRLIKGAISSVALPGLGANTGKVPVDICADLMWTAYNLFREEAFESFADMRAALEEELGALGNAGAAPAKPKAPIPPAVMAPGVKGPVIPPKSPVIPGKPAVKGPVIPGPAAKPKPIDDFDDSE